MHIQSCAGAWQFRQAGTAEWLPASVPGGVHTDLMAAGLIPDPFAGDNEKRVQWVADSDWEYRYRFSCAPELLAHDRIRLVCDGLDTLADVSLNGLRLGRTDNMFRQYFWDVTAALGASTVANAGVDELTIKFTSPLRGVRDRQAARPLPGVSQALPGGPYLRKSPCQFGWDWGPQLPPIGIWKDIRLEGHTQARIEDVHLRQFRAGEAATVTANLSIQRWGETPLTAVLRIVSPTKEVFETSAVIAGDAAAMQLTIPQPQLWWPAGYGDQPLYDAQITLYAGDPVASAVLDRRAYRIGLRTVELCQQEDQWGRSFSFVVNGEPIFVKGSNWIPADSFPTRVTDERLTTLVRAAAETGQNMLRVWGGGVYEDDRFYDLCDRYGILVWQEFIFSCSIYPLDSPEMLENVQVEAVQNIRRLRHHASLALWCGNNEMEWGWTIWGWDRPDLQDLKAAYDQFFHRTLPEWCQAQDPDHAYWPSSPSSHTPFENPNSQSQGDAHYWDVWHGRRPFSAYRSQFPRFMSEFGFQSLPPLATIRTYADPADWNMTSYVMEAHQRSASGNGLMVAQMTDHFRLPRDWASLVYLSLVLQAEGIRTGVEHWRRHRDRVAGILYWQLNDCWPVASWSSLDYFGRWKALHYAARRFYAPVLLSIEDGSRDLAIYVTNDLRAHWSGSVQWSLETLQGRVLVSGQESVEAPPQCALRLRTLDFSDRIGDDNRRELVFVAELWQNASRVALQTALFAPTKHLSLTDPAVTAELRRDDDRVSVDLASRSLARLVELLLDGVDVVFSDNYFDLPAGRNVAVSFPLPAGWTLERVSQALRIRSVYDTFAEAPSGAAHNGESLGVRAERER
ncbi:MAG: glycoside hydrolase family 2 protein [Chloroflexi bacterium]|nr:glycoside hydrolase family 2 protein [Chloroflexota bacterium]